MTDITWMPRPETFFQLSGAVTGVVGLALAIVAAFGVRLVIRLAAMLLVVTLAVYSNNAWNYFAAIFIIASAVTELEFLERLAAIIRGSKEYFDYAKSQVPIDEVRAKVAAEAEAAENLAATPDETHSASQEQQQPNYPAEHRILKPAGDASTLGFAIEQLALSFLERRLGASIQRNMRFSTPDAQVEFDGVIEKSGGRPDTLVEVKIASPSNLRRIALDGAKLFLSRKKVFRDLTGRRTTGVLLIVVPDKKVVPKSDSDLKAEVQALSHTLQFELADFTDIGFSPPT
jgi:hypothetical protein